MGRSGRSTSAKVWNSAMAGRWPPEMLPFHSTCIRTQKNLCSCRGIQPTLRVSKPRLRMKWSLPSPKPFPTWKASFMRCMCCRDTSGKTSKIPQSSICRSASPWEAVHLSWWNMYPASLSAWNHAQATICIRPRSVASSSGFTPIFPPWSRIFQINNWTS